MSGLPPAFVTQRIQVLQVPGYSDQAEPGRYVLMRPADLPSHTRMLEWLLPTGHECPYCHGTLVTLPAGVTAARILLVDREGPLAEPVPGDMTVLACDPCDQTFTVPGGQEQHGEA